MNRKRTTLIFLIAVALVIGTTIVTWFLQRHMATSRSTDEPVSFSDKSVRSRSTELAPPSTVEAPSPDASAGTTKAQSRPQSLPTHRNSLRDATLRQLEPLAGDLALQIPKLERRAKNGDAKAAVDLWYGLDRCKSVLSESEINYLRSGVAPDPRAYAKVQSATLESCKGVTADQITGRFSWLKQAAADGDQQSQYLYASTGASAFNDVDDAQRDPQAWDEYKRTATVYLDALAQQCDPSAISYLWWSYKRGDLFFAPDLEKALFYTQISELLSPSENTPAILAAAQKGLAATAINSQTQAAGQFYQSHCR